MREAASATEVTRPASAGTAPPAPIADRVASLDWARIGADLDARGCAVTGRLLTPQECEALASGYDADAPFRSRVVMTRHGFGRSEYKYYAYPLPEPVAVLRTALYPPLAEVANRWEAMLGRVAGFPPDHGAYLARCHEAGQARPTPLLLRYGPGDYNCLHQDLYGALHFPLQVAFLLS